MIMRPVAYLCGGLFALSLSSCGNTEVDKVKAAGEMNRMELDDLKEVELEATRVELAKLEPAAGPRAPSTRKAPVVRAASWAKLKPGARARVPRAAQDAPQGISAEDFFHPRKVAAGVFAWCQKAAKNPRSLPWTYTRVQYIGKTFWVVDVHLGDSVPYKLIAVYAPAKDGSFQRCLVAASNGAGCLAMFVDQRTGVLELRESANSSIKGEVVLSCNLKTIGTPHSTGEAP
jgi:hypothetical protein